MEYANILPPRFTKRRAPVAHTLIFQWYCRWTRTSLALCSKCNQQLKFKWRKIIEWIIYTFEKNISIVFIQFFKSRLVYHPFTLFSIVHLCDVVIAEMRGEAAIAPLLLKCDCCWCYNNRNLWGCVKGPPKYTTMIASN